MKSKKMQYGSWCQIAHPAIGEILAKSGFDFVTLDCEHGEAENSDIANFCRAVHGGGAKALIRVMENSTMAIRRALDLGADGVIVPLVESADEARQAVASALYPPAGIRGFAWHNGNDYGENFSEYAQNFTPQIMVMCESVKAVENMAEIAAVDGVDGIVIGPYDLSGSMGIPGKTADARVVEACAAAAKACITAGKAAGFHIVTPTEENIQCAIDQGYTFLALGMDTHFLISGAKAAKGLIK